MNRFAFANPTTLAEAGTLLATKTYKLPVLKAGGLDVLDHMKEGLMEPDLLINIKRVRSQPQAVSIAGEGAKRRLIIDATTTLAELATSPIVLKEAPVVAQASGSAATPQVRNVASAAGNILQRPRCWYYRQEQFECLKKGGETCPAVGGENKYHAIFSDGPCHIVHPSNLALALAACGAEAELEGSGRRIPIGELLHAPKNARSEHTLGATDIIRAIYIVPAPVSAFYAIKEKQSFDWPLVMAGVSLTMNGDKIGAATVVAGAVAPTPHPLPKIAAALAGVRPADDAALRTAIAPCIEGAKPLSQNAYKLKLLPVAIRRAVLKAAGLLKEDHA